MLGSNNSTCIHLHINFAYIGEVKLSEFIKLSLPRVSVCQLICFQTFDFKNVLCENKKIQVLYNQLRTFQLYLNFPQGVEA